MTNKIKLTKGSWGSWECVIESDNGKGDFTETKINEKGINLDRTELLEIAIHKLGIELEYVVDGRVVK